MKLIELEPSFLKITDNKTHRRVGSIEEADGIWFICPKCFTEAGTNVGVHWVICWQPHVPQTREPKPGRWSFEGTGYHDLTLVAKSSSILLTSAKGCKAHFFIKDGKIA